MGAAPAYSRYPARAPERVQRAPRIQVVPGSGRAPDIQAISPSAVFLAKTIAVVLVVLTLLCFARIALTTATVTTSLQTQELSSQISSARAAGNQLEVSQSSLANPTRVKAEAGALRMAAAADTITFTLGRDVVATDGSGNLSLSRSIALAAEA